MVYDLNISWSPSTTTDALMQTLTMSSSLGYSTVALTHVLELPIPAKHKAPFPSIPESSPSSSSPLPAVLHRATLPLGDPSGSNYRLSSLVGVYDILAVRPLTEKAFQNACLTLDVPLISPDMTTHFPFHFRPKPCMAAVARGVRFEICYAQLLAADPRGRANFISNVTSLVRATRGRGIVISSEARTALALRGPADVVNLLNVWGLANDKGLDGLRSIPRSVVLNEGIKRTGFRGVINVVQVASSDKVGPGTGGLSDDNGNEQGTNMPRPGKKAKNQKRKHTTGQEDDGQHFTKRQAKKAKHIAQVSGS